MAQNNPGQGTGISIDQDQPEFHRSNSQSHSRRGSDVLEATELARIRSDYSRATDLYGRASSSASRASPTGLGRWKHTIAKFWRSQISIVVPYVACRDHLGMYCTLCYHNTLTYLICSRLAHRSYKAHAFGERMRVSVCRLMQLASPFCITHVNLFMASAWMYDGSPYWKADHLSLANGIVNFHCRNMWLQDHLN
jgi:hypothetical protein